MDVLAQIRETINTTKAALADGKITWEESKAIALEVSKLLTCLLEPTDTPDP